MSRFTAVVVVHESRPHLERLLDSLDAHLPGAAQTVVVDTGSRDGGAALAAERGCEVVALDGNPGFGAANNAGVARAEHDVTVLLNPDVRVLDAGLLELVALARDRDALLFPRLLNPDGSVQDSAHPRPGTVAEVLRAAVPARLAPQPWRASRPRPVGWAIAAALVARTATLRRLGPFDPDAFLFYEDLDLCLRATSAGSRASCGPRSPWSTSGATRRDRGGWRPRRAGAVPSSASAWGRARGRSTTSRRR